MGLLTMQPQVRPQMPSMPGGLPTWNAQQPQGPRPMAGAMGGPQQQNAQSFMQNMPQINLNIPQYGHGYEGGMNLDDMGRMQSLQSAFRTSYMPVPMGPWSLAGQRVTGPDMPFESLGPRMNGEMPVTWYAEDWKRNLPD